MHIRSFQSGILAFALGLEAGLDDFVFIVGAEDVCGRVVILGVGLETVLDGLDTAGVPDGPTAGELETPGAAGAIVGVGVEAMGCGVDAIGVLVDFVGWIVALTGTTRGFVAGWGFSRFDMIPGTAAMPFARRSSRGFF